MAMKINFSRLVPALSGDHALPEYLCAARALNWFQARPFQECGCAVHAIAQNFRRQPSRTARLPAARVLKMRRRGCRSVCPRAENPFATENTDSLPTSECGADR